MRLGLDAGARRALGGRVVLGGSPFRIVRLDDGATIDEVLEDEVGRERLRAEPIATLLAIGLVHPQPDREGPSLAEVDVVIPTKDRGAGLRALLDLVGAMDAASVTVVDDGSAEAVMLDGAPHIHLLRNRQSLGPAFARNRGAAAGSAPFVLFMDDDIVIGVEPGSLIGGLLRWFELPTVGAVAPRVRTSPGPGLLARYEQERGVLDLGPAGGPVASGTRLPFVPTAALLVRRAALEQVGGFRPELSRGEDVDLVWRLADAGWMVRYDPDHVIEHPVRPTLWAWLAQRVRYGRSTSELVAEHPGRVRALEVSPWSAAAWGLAMVGGPLGLAAAVVLWAGSTAAFVPALRGRVDDPVADARLLAGGGTLHAGSAIATAIRRSWAPALAVAALRLVPARRALALAMLAPLLERRDSDRAVGRLGWLVGRVLDDLASCTGLWRGLATDRRAWRALAVRWHRGDDLFLDLPCEGDAGSVDVG